METAEQKTDFKNWVTIHNFMHPNEPIKSWVNENNYTNHYSESWSELIPVIKKLDSWANEKMTFEEFDNYRSSNWKMIDNPSKYHIEDVCKQVAQFIEHYNPEQKETEKNSFKKLKEKHEKLRDILIENRNTEHGDCIIDEICELFGEQPTTVYYEDNDEEFLNNILNQ